MGERQDQSSGSLLFAVFIVGCVLLTLTGSLVNACNQISEDFGSSEYILCDVTTITSSIQPVMSNTTGLEASFIFLTTTNGSFHYVSNIRADFLNDMYFAELRTKNESEYAMSRLQLSNGTYIVRSPYGYDFTEYGSGKYAYAYFIEQLREPTVLDEFILEIKPNLVYSFDLLFSLSLCMVILPTVSWLLSH